MKELIGLVIAVLVLLLTLMMYFFPDAGRRATREIWPEPNIEVFESLPPQITKGQTAKLHWKVAPEPKPDEVLLAGESVGLEGWKLVSPSKETSYELVARNKQGKTSKIASIAVLPKPIEVRFEADRHAVRKGETVNISWDVSPEAERVEIIPMVGVVERRGRRAVTIDENTTFKLTAQGQSPALTAELSIAALETEGHLFAEPPTIHIGEKTTLKWNTNSTSVQLQVVAGAALGSFSGSGSLEVAPAANTTYEVIANGPTGEKRFPATVFVLPPLAPVLKASLTPEQIQVGQSTTLSWSCQHCTRIRVENMGEFGPSGSIPIRPATAPGGYELKVVASGPGGDTVYPVHFVVASAPKQRLLIQVPERLSGLVANHEAAQIVREKLSAFFADRYEIVVPSSSPARMTGFRSSNTPVHTADLICDTSLAARAEKKDRGFGVVEFTRLELTVQTSIEVVRARDKLVLGRGSGSAKKSGTISWRTSPGPGGRADPRLRLEAEVVAAAVSDALNRYRSLR